MIIPIKIEDLSVGMYVILPISWFKHPFFKNSFLTTTEGQIKKIYNSGLKEIKIDTSKGLDVQEKESITHKGTEPGSPEREHGKKDNSENLNILEVGSLSHKSSPSVPPDDWNPNKDIAAELKDAIYNQNISPEKKAEIVYKNSVELMNRLLETPTAEMIGEGKKAIFHTVDLILSDADTSSYLMDITSHDFYTYTHSVNVGIFSVSLSKRLYEGTTDHDMHELGAGFFLHDLGKTRVNPAIINKPGRLTDKEMQKMRIHPYQSYKILEETNHLSEEAKIVALQHHEREDGTGYPRRLKGNEIHDYGRICCIADVFDALTAKRSYKKAMTPFEALKVMKEDMLGHFHKKIFENFVMLFQK